MIAAQPSTYSHPRVTAVQQRDAAHRRVRRITFGVATLTIAAAAAGALALGTPKAPLAIAPAAPVSVAQPLAGTPGTP